MYVVLLPEEYLTEVFIEADSEEEAIKAVMDGDGECGESYYRETITGTDWEIHLVEEAEVEQRLKYIRSH